MDLGVGVSSHELAYLWLGLQPDRCVPCAVKTSNRHHSGKLEAVVCLYAVCMVMAYFCSFHPKSLHVGDHHGLDACAGKKPVLAHLGHGCSDSVI